MSTALENQQETAEKMFFAAVGAPVMLGQRMKDLLSETTFEDLEKAGREFAEHIQDNKVVEQIQDTVDYEQFQEKVDVLREQLETLLTSWRDQFDPSVKESVKIEVEAFRLADALLAPRGAIDLETEPPVAFLASTTLILLPFL